MSKLRILIADDEPLARDRLRVLLASASVPCEVAGEAANGPETVAAVVRLHPDVMLLDVQMPGCDGFEVVAQLPASERPAVIFVTAHEQFAVTAFSLQAADYLLKPFTRERLHEALGRAGTARSTQRASELSRRLAARLAAASTVERLAIPCDGRVVFVRTDEVVWVEAASNYSMMHLLDKRRLMVRASLSSMEQRLGSRHFTRVNRSALARIDQVRELQSVGYGDYAVVLRSGDRLSLSRQLRGRIEHFLATFS
jgi:two-component system LytT family response regulator